MPRSLRFLKSGKINLLGIESSWNVKRVPSRKQSFHAAGFKPPYLLHLGPGPNWKKPNEHWINVDADPKWADVVVNFAEFEEFPLPSGSVSGIYGSHVFEHMSIWVTDKVFHECHRVLEKGGVMRLVLPDVERSIREYVNGNEEFELFKRRRQRAKKLYGLDYTIFDCLREDFLSRSGQQHLLGAQSLAHQNAWDFNSISSDLQRAGFSQINRSHFRDQTSSVFNFEGSYESEAMEDYRSLYVEAIKQ